MGNKWHQTDGHQEIFQKEMDADDPRAANELLSQKARAAEILKDPKSQILMLARVYREARDIPAPGEGASYIVGMVAANKDTMRAFMPELILTALKCAKFLRLSPKEMAEMFAWAEAEMEKMPNPEN